MNRDHILFKIGRIQYKTNKILLQELRNYGVTGIFPSHGEIIGSLLLNGPLQMKDIARIIDKDKSTVTALTDKLIRLHYVVKHRDSDDNRVSIISLTEKGKALKPYYKEISKSLREQAYKGFSDDEKKLLCNMLEKLDSNLSKQFDAK